MKTIKITIKAKCTENGMEELLFLKNKIESGELQRELKSECDGIKQVTATFEILD